jgi:hypothetical protein
VKRLLAAPARILFAGTLLLLIVANHRAVFETPWHEQGDFALNALQIERAKNFNEVHGNYSRFHFNHPGPAFFYVYAAGEWLFHDALQIVPTQANAHILAGLVLQASFFAGALGIMASWVRSRWFMPVAAALAALHYKETLYAFNSIWPPHVLLMPFLCFLAASASVGAGRASHLWVMVLSGGFLVHGHVAQPLFVGSLALAGYAGLCWHGPRPRQAPWRLHRREHLIAGGILAVFLVPLAIDLTSGSESNLAAILSFYSAPKQHHTWSESLAYLTTFFGYWHDVELLVPEGEPVSFAHVLARGPVYLMWAGIVVAGIFSWWRLRRRGDDPETRFLNAFAVILAVAFLACLYWGKAQTGPLFEFNSFFVHSLSFSLLAFAWAGWSPVVPDRGAWRVALWVIGPLLLSLGAMAFSKAMRAPESTTGARYDWFAATRTVLSADPAEKSPKYLVFAHDDWGDVARTALALKRLGKSYRTDRSWAYMFGHYRTLATDRLDNLGGYSIWRFSRRDLPGPHMELPSGLRVYFEPFELDPHDATILCTREGNLDRYLLFGITSPENGFTWTNLPRAGLRFRSPPVERDVTITLEAEPFLPSPLKAQPMRLMVNGQPVGEFLLAQRDTVTARVQASVWNRSPVVTVVMEFPAARSPRETGLSADPRRIAWGLHSIRFVVP